MRSNKYITFLFLFFKKKPFIHSPGSVNSTTILPGVFQSDKNGLHLVEASSPWASRLRTSQRSVFVLPVSSNINILSPESLTLPVIFNLHFHGYLTGPDFSVLSEQE